MYLEIYIFVLIAVNVILMAYIFYDRFVLLKKQSKNIAEKVFEEGLYEALDKIDGVMKEFKKEMKETITKSNSIPSTLRIDLEQDLKSIHQSEIQKVQEFSQELYNILLSTTELIKKELQQYILKNKDDITQWSDEIKKAIEQASKEMIETEKDLLTQYIEDERVNARTMLKDMVMRDIDTIIKDVIKNGINVQDQEVLVLNAINLYFKESRP